MQGLRGLATGVGSMPQKNAAEALDLIFKYLPNIPFWPQLPKRNIREGMVAQFSENLPFLKMNENGLNFSSSDVREAELETFYGHIIDNDVDYFKISKDFALGLYEFHKRLEKSGLKTIDFIKLQVTGPFTFAAGLKDQNGVALLHDTVFMQAVLKGLTMKALWQLKFFKNFGKKIIIFIDEPFLGCFGSAFTPINREDVVKVLTELSLGIKQSEDTLIGIHCCGNTDWSMFTDVDGIDIINFDAFSFQERFVLYAQNLALFLKKAGIVCWGIVPTQEFSGKETPDSLVKKLMDGIGTLIKKGVDRDLLLRQMLVSPSCGLGSLDTAISERILNLLSETSSFIRKSP